MLPPPQEITPNDQPNQIDLNPATMLEKVDSWVDGFVRLVPNIVVGLIVFVLFCFLARFAGRTIQNRFRHRDRENLGTIASSFIRWVIVIAGFFLAATIIVPSLNPGDLVAGLGVGSVAIGFAFKDILQNWLAGLLILLRQPFQVGDQIVVNNFEGTVERIETRATIIKQYNAEQVVIPNSDIYTNAVKVKTANQYIRSQYDVGIGYGDSIAEASDVISKAVQSVEGVEVSKGVDVLTWDLAASWVTLRVRWWTDSRRANVVNIHNLVLKKIKLALDEASIDMPFETQVQLFHDQTEETDGDREAQREGWPTDAKGKSPRSRYRAQVEDRAEAIADENAQQDTDGAKRSQSNKAARKK